MRLEMSTGQSDMVCGNYCDKLALTTSQVHGSGVQKTHKEQAGHS